MITYLYLGATSLHLAAWNGHSDMVKILLDHGANVSAKDNKGKKDYITVKILVLKGS